MLKGGFKHHVQTAKNIKSSLKAENERESNQRESKPFKKKSVFQLHFVHRTMVNYILSLLRKRTHITANQMFPKIHTHTFRQTYYHTVFSIIFNSRSHHLTEVFPQSFTKLLRLSKLSMFINPHPNVPASRGEKIKVTII